MRAEREREVVGTGRSGERPKSASKSLFHHKTTGCKKLKIDFKTYHETVSVTYYFVCCVENKSDYPTQEQCMLNVGIRNSYAQLGPCK